MKLLLSTGVLEGFDAGAVIKLARHLKLDGIELIHSNISADEDIRMLKGYVKRYGRFVRNVHMPFFMESLLKYVLRPRAVSSAMIRGSSELAASIGARNLVIHPFPALLIKGRIRDVMASVLRESSRPGLNISIENLELRRFLGIRLEPCCLSDYDDLFRFCKENGFSISLDTAHCMSKGIDPSSFFERYGSLINNIHLSNLMGWQAHCPLDCGIIDFRRFFATLDKSGYDGCLTLEINPTTREEVMRNVGLMRELIG
jgi:sugar phosphate isomerase/epimerase